jgi:SAM-dependent methyltransferase
MPITAQDHTNTAAEEAKWLEVAAEEKARSVVRLSPVAVKTVVDIGAGSGAVLSALDRAGFADRYWACEPSTLYAEIPRIGRLVDAENKTFDEAFGEMTFDLAILSHVVEHLLTPAVLIARALARARFVIIEVPLDGSPAGNSRSWIRKQRGVARLDNEAGHVQFFSRRSAQELVTHSGGVVDGVHGYFPRAAYAALAGNRLQRIVLKVARFEALGRLYHEHYAMLCSKRELDDWHHIYAKPV